MSNQLPEILTIQEMSIYLRIPLRSMYKLAQEGKLPGQKVGRHWRFRREAVDHWLDNNPYSPNAKFAAFSETTEKSD